MDIIRKTYLDRIGKYYDSNLIKVLTGIRRCGKSVLLRQIRDEILETVGVESDHIIEMNFEDVAFSRITTFKKLNSYILKRIKDDKKYYIFLDEIQHVSQFEKTLSSLKATKNVSIFVTGSNSKLLSGRLASLLVGRCKEFKIMPFTYSEFMQYNAVNGISLSNSFQDYLRFGGMPQRMDYDNEDEIREYLSSLFDGIVNKDICNSKSKINRENFDTVSKYILSNCGKEFSAASVSSYFSEANGEKMFRETVYRYLDKLEKACLISRVKRYDVASKRNLKSVEKQYAADTGMVLACSSSNRVFPSRLLENAVYNELVYKGYDVMIGKTYKGEIDFVVMKDGKKCFLQVAYLLSDESVIEREFGAYDSVKDRSPKYVLSLDEFDMSRDGVVHLNIVDWMTNKKDLFLS
ncbi:MAG: ATP-binding protein [Bacilli bacterium]|nr:ATP-binding protein [Bacilli bacterium]